MLPYADYIAALSLIGGAWDGSACTFDSNRVRLLAWVIAYASEAR